MVASAESFCSMSVSFPGDADASYKTSHSSLCHLHGNSAIQSLVKRLAVRVGCRESLAAAQFGRDAEVSINSTLPCATGPESGRAGQWTEQRELCDVWSRQWTGVSNRGV